MMHVASLVTFSKKIASLNLPTVVAIHSKPFYPTGGVYLSPSTAATVVCLLPKASFTPNPPPSLAGTSPKATCQLAPTKLPSCHHALLPKVWKASTLLLQVLSCVLPNCSDAVDPLECTLSSLQSTYKLLWDKKLTFRFKTAQEHLSNYKSIVLPCSSDILW